MACKWKGKYGVRIANAMFFQSVFQAKRRNMLSKEEQLARAFSWEILFFRVLEGG